MRAIFDTNIIIDWLAGNEKAHRLLMDYEDAAISVITWMEVMVGVADTAQQTETRQLLDGLERIELEAPIVEKAVSLRRNHRLKLWDSIIWATAIYEDVVLITRNTKDFPQGDRRILFPYHV